MSKYYKLTSTYAAYIEGKAEMIMSGTYLALAGNHLSIMTDKSPFHYKDTIIRIPHSIIEEVRDTCETKKVEKVWELVISFCGRDYKESFDHVPKDSEVLAFHKECMLYTTGKIPLKEVKVNLKYKIIDNV